MNLNISKKWFERQAALEGDLEIGSGLHACHCIGPQNGQPVCPCAMRSVTVENGRYVQKQDLGPAKSESLRERMTRISASSLRTLRDR